MGTERSQCVGRLRAISLPTSVAETKGRAPMLETEEIVAALVAIEERLRDLAYDSLRQAVAEGDAEAQADERRLLQARRAVERAIHALGGGPEEL